MMVADDLYRFFHPGEAEGRALRGASLAVDRGETVALVGPSGSGKSTLLACIAGLDEPDGGLVTIEGRRMTRRSEAQRAALRAASIGYLAQSGNLFAHLSVAANVTLQLDLCGGRGGRARVEELLRLVGLGDRADATPAALSGGEAARAGLAVALAGDPPLLLADEPTAEVDAETEARILDILEERRAKGGAALIATHSRSLGARATRVAAIADRRRPLWPSQMAFVSQSPSLAPGLPVIENGRLPLDIAGLDSSEAMDPAEALMRLSLTDLSDKLPDQLSGGQMQRVALARALATRPKLLLADEPTGQLDRATAQAVMQALLAALEGGDTALLVATHDESVADWMDERWRMEAGRLTRGVERPAA